LVGENSNDLNAGICALQEAGYTVFTADNGFEAFRLIRREYPDLILSKVMLSDLSGWELCKMVRADRYMRTTPFALLGDADEDIEDIKKGLDAGADDYLPAFFDSQYLVAKIEWLIEKRSSIQNLKEFVRTVHSRQIRITKVVKETSGLMKELDSELRSDYFVEAAKTPYELEIDKRVDLGIGMIGAIANLLEEENKAMSGWENSPAFI
jgi:DNA-binding response OmpR family regulator